MRVAAVLVDFPPRRWIGAELATAALLQDLVRAGHDVAVLSLEAQQPYRWGGLRVLPLPAAEGAAARMLQGADLVVTHPYLGRGLAVPVEECGAPVAMMVHSTWDHVRLALEQRRWDVALPNSLSTAAGLGLDPGTVVRPPSPPPQPRRRDGRSGLIGFINGSRAKGGEALEDLARRGRRLLGVSGGWADAPAGPLVQAVSMLQMPPEQMARDYWSRIAVHAQPSLRESWGMAAVEALAMGVPVAASDLPGLRESLGGAGAGWVEWFPAGDAAGLRGAVDRLAAAPRGGRSRQGCADHVAGLRAAAAADRARTVRALEGAFA